MAADENLGGFTMVFIVAFFILVAGVNGIEGQKIDAQTTTQGQ